MRQLFDPKYHPPPPPFFQIDLEIESGEYFLSKAQKDANALQAKKEAQADANVKRQEERQKAFIAPKEIISNPSDVSKTKELTVAELTEKIKASTSSSGGKRKVDDEEASSFIVSSSSKKKSKK